MAAAVGGLRFECMERGVGSLVPWVYTPFPGHSSDFVLAFGFHVVDFATFVMGIVVETDDVAVASGETVECERLRRRGSFRTEILDYTNIAAKVCRDGCFTAKVFADGFTTLR